MHILIISTSLNPHSRSAVLARRVQTVLEERGISHEYIDMRRISLPFCDGDRAFNDSNVKKMRDKICDAHGLLFAAPIYNYDVNAVLKNLLELTGRAWQQKVVGLMITAGARSSYMAPVSFLNSLMLDYRCLVVPRYVFALEEDVIEGHIVNPDLEKRIDTLVDSMLDLLTRGQK